MKNTLELVFEKLQLFKSEPKGELTIVISNEKIDKKTSQILK